MMQISALVPLLLGIMIVIETIIKGAEPGEVAIKVKSDDNDNLTIKEVRINGQGNWN
jgi:hypothetical protein